jgi:hypothetical protein
MSQRRIVESILPEVLEEEIERSEFSKENSQNHEDHKIQVTRRIRRDKSITLVTGANVDP